MDKEQFTNAAEAIKTVSISLEAATNLLSFEKSYKKITKADLLEHCLNQRVELLSLKAQRDELYEALKEIANAEMLAGDDWVGNIAREALKKATT